jgi:hypothetical protein
MARKDHPRPSLTRDHARPRSAPAPTTDALDARLTDLIQPLTFALGDEYRRLGCRWRVLSLPVMVSLVVTMIWRQLPSVSELLRVLVREGTLWTPPLRVSQQALSQRLRCFPPDLFAHLLERLTPLLLTRAAARQRPRPPVITRLQAHFPHLWLADATTLEPLFRKVGLCRDVPDVPLGGTLLALLDLPSKLPHQVWFDPDPDANEKRFLPQVQAALPAGVLLVVDAGFYSFPLFDWLTETDRHFLTRARSVAAFTVRETLPTGPTVRDRVIQLGQYRSNPCRHPVRLVEVQVGGHWRAYLTNVLDPAVLTPADMVDLYARRWRIEEAFLLVKRLLGLSYLWTGAVNGLALQVWATWLLYAVLVDLSDAVAEELDQPLEAISLEMVYRGLYHYCGAFRRGETDDPVAYLAAQSDLGIVKRRRKSRERQRLDTLPPELNL